jgi:hypothetical protein
VNKKKYDLIKSMMKDGKECLLRDHNNKMFFVIIKVKMHLAALSHIAFG